MILKVYNLFMENKIKIIIISIILLTGAYFGYSYYTDNKILEASQNMKITNLKIERKDYEEREKLDVYFNDLKNKNIDSSYLVLVIKSINYNLRNQNDINVNEINILIDFYEGKYKSKFIDIASDLSHDIFVSIISKLLSLNKMCEKAKLFSGKIKKFNSIKDDTDNFIVMCKEK